jgi:hypothetical protein
VTTQQDDALTQHKVNDRVISVHAYIYPVQIRLQRWPSIWPSNRSTKMDSSDRKLKKVLSVFEIESVD